MSTSIEWTDETWNPTRGCSRVSEGCRFCYAERQAARNLPGSRSPTTGEAFAIIRNGWPHWTGKVELIESKLQEPLHWKKPRRVFVNSMSDLWHELLPRVDIARCYAVMAYCQWLDFQVLTKRPEVRFRYCGLEYDVRFLLQSLLKENGPPPHAKPFRWPLPNVWEGVSVEDQANKDRIDLLRQTPAAVRFLSIEPLLEHIGELDLTGIHWGIVGGESGPQARPCDLDWIESIVDQFAASGRPLFVKQVGSKPVRCAPGCLTTRYPITDSKGGNLEEWPEKIRIREFPR